MNILVILLIVALIMIVALLWYRIRTGKTAAQLETKINTSVDSKLAAMKAETRQAIEAAKSKL